MQDQSAVRAIIAETISAITTHPTPPDFNIVLHLDDKLEAPCLMIQIVSDTKVMVGIEIPYRFWYPVPESILRAIVGIELVNYFAPELTLLEQEMIEHISILRRQSTDPTTIEDRVNEVRFRYEVERRLIDVQLARKLDGDADVYRWFVKTGYNPFWLIEFFELMIAEAPQRTRPAGRIQPRIEAFRTRIQHMTYLMEGNVTAAESLRHQFASHAPCS